MPTIISDAHRVGAPPASEKQRNFLLRLAGDRVFPRLGESVEERVTTVENLIITGELTGSVAGRLIDALLRAPVDPGAREAERTRLTPGVYEVNGEIFNVKFNKAKTNLYAQRLIELPGVDRLAESGDVVHIEFEYAPGVVRRLRPHHRMPIGRARELTIRYGRCLACGRRLKNADSVERGIGPVCRRAFTN